jgi:hypothetical protein
MDPAAAQCISEFIGSRLEHEMKGSIRQWGLPVMKEVQCQAKLWQDEGTARGALRFCEHTPQPSKQQQRPLIADAAGNKAGGPAIAGDPESWRRWY